MTSTMWVKLRRPVVAVLVAAFWLSVWCLGVYLANRSLLMPLPYPWEVAVALWEKMGDSGFWMDVLNSFSNVITGFLLAMVAGCGLAVLTTRFALFHALFSPVLSIVRAVPVVTFIFLVFLRVIPLVWENVRQGILHTDSQLLEMAQVFRMPFSRRLLRIWLPSVRPYLQAAISTGFGFAWKSGIAAEVICTPADSIGRQLYSAKAYLETPEVFAWTVTVVLLSVLLERVLLYTVKRKAVAK